MPESQSWLPSDQSWVLELGQMSRSSQHPTQSKFVYIRRMASQVRQRWIRGMIRIGISAVLLLVFALHVQGHNTMC
ncbi:MAG: hypothetical protein IIA07_02120 [Proteobacteria bacterium]|nr:hypothetical protein [Pseudomonadota bacterium]